MNSRGARSVIAESCSAIHASFGPTAWLDSADPQRARIASSPNSWLSRSICAPARVSTPYRIAGPSGSPF